MNQRSATFILILTAFAAASSAHACSVPVFRYALEAWTPAEYELLLFHRGKMSDADRATLDAMRKNAEDAKAPVNISFTPIDVAEKMDERIQKVWDEHKSDALPRAVAVYPDSGDAFFTGALATDLPRKLADSPARSEIARRIASGESVIFVLLESGNKDLDSAAAALLEKELIGLQATMKLPKQDDTDEEVAPRRRQLDLPLKLSFSIMKIARSDAKEKLFIDLLMKTDKKLTADKPIVFPVFGRGRLLCAFAGAMITPANLAESATFLSGACSCQVKELNPGVDLLMSVNWDELLEKAVETAKNNPTGGTSVPAAVSKAKAATKSADVPTVVTDSAASVIITSPVTVPAAQSNTPERAGMLYIAIGGVLVLVVVTGIWALRSSKT